MGDRSYVNIQVYQCPEKDWDGFVAILTQFGIAINDVEYPSEFPYDITDEEVRLSSMAEALQVVSVASPEIYFWGQQDAYYEYYGDRCINVEEGYSWRETDNSSHVALTPDQLEKIDAQPGDLKEKLLEHFATMYVNAAREWQSGKRTSQYQIQEAPTLP